MRRSRVTVLVLPLFLLLIAAGHERLIAQDSSRSLRVWVDTLNLGLCGPKEFDSWAVWLESYTDNDTVVGFRREDSVYGFSLTLRWDTGRVTLEPPYILTPVNSLGGRLVSKTQFVDPDEGVLWVSISTDATLRTAVGLNIPLIYMMGHAKETDTTFGIPEGGARVQSFEIEGVLGDNRGLLRFPPGFVNVVRDTTPEYTVTLVASSADLDTNLTDTVHVVARNISLKRLSELEVTLIVDTSYCRFIDTLSTAGQVLEWTTKEVQVESGKVIGRFGTDAEQGIETSDSVLFSVLVERSKDSAFATDLELEFGQVNETTCVGKIELLEGRVSADSLPRADTTDTTSNLVALQQRRTENEQVDVKVVEKVVRVSVGVGRLVRVTAIKVTGESIGVWNAERGRREVLIDLKDLPESGWIGLIIEGDLKRHWYKQLIQRR